ncbi:MAG: hypothetical protein KDA92_13620, partial [Planctomycetales bacterium]|nr:hypothetical protein [Planctomycetales bacterium]
NWADHKTIDSSQPLTLTQHVGGNPIGFYVTRKRPSAEEQAFMQLWSGKLVGYVDRLATTFLNPAQAEFYGKAKEKLLPLLARANTANKELLAPGFADNQHAIVFDAQLESRQWHMSMPKSETKLPLPELSFVCGVADAAKVQAAGVEYFSILQDTVTAISELAPEKVPPYTLPEPKKRDFGTDGAVYYYMVPPFIGLDPSLAPNVGLSQSTFVCSLVPLATQRLMKQTPLQYAGVNEAAADRPLAAMWQFHTDRFIEVVRPWVRYGFQIAEQDGAVDKELAAHVHTVLDVIACVKLASGNAFVEDDALVSQSRIEFEDVAP